MSFINLFHSPTRYQHRLLFIKSTFPFWGFKSVWTIQIPSSFYEEECLISFSLSVIISTLVSHYPLPIYINETCFNPCQFLNSYRHCISWFKLFPIRTYDVTFTRHLLRTLFNTSQQLYETVV